MEEENHSTFTIFFVLLLVVCIVIINLPMAAPEALFIFGDSTVDVGTNNYLNESLALADFPYNGIDFPGSVPTGRFSNGYNIADFLAMLFGFERSPQPYLLLVNNQSSFGKEILKGVNFASGGSGLLYDTGMKLWHQVVPLCEQVQQFALVKGNISELMGETQTAKFLSNSIFIVSVGSNDILDPFRLGINVTQDYLLSKLNSAYRQQIMYLYNLGARRFGIIPAGSVGCCPSMLALNKTESGDGGCMTQPNEFAQAFYSNVEILMQNMSSAFSDMKYSLANSYAMTDYMLKNYGNYGFTNSNDACCGSGYDNGLGFCNKTQNPNLCDNRNAYLFWDLYHPTSAASDLSALILYYGFGFVSPISFQSLADG